MTSAQVLNNSSLRRNPLEPTGKSYRAYQGSPHPFGSTVEIEGVNFSLYSSSATNVRLLIFNKPDDLDPVIEISLDSIENKSFNICRESSCVVECSNNIFKNNNIIVCYCSHNRTRRSTCWLS